MTAVVPQRKSPMDTPPRYLQDGNAPMVRTDPKSCEGVKARNLHRAREAREAREAEAYKYLTEEVDSDVYQLKDRAPGHRIASDEDYPGFNVHPPGDDFLRNDLPGMQRLNYRDPSGLKNEADYFKDLYRLLRRDIKSGTFNHGDLRDLPKPVRDLMETDGLFTPLMSSVMDNVDIATSQLGRSIVDGDIARRIVVLRDEHGRPLSLGVSEILLNKLSGNTALEDFKRLLIESEAPLGAALIATGLSRKVVSDIKGRFSLPVGGVRANDFVSRVLDMAQDQEERSAIILNSGQKRLLVPNTMLYTQPGHDRVVSRVKVMSFKDGSKKIPFARVFDIPLIQLDEKFLPDHVVKAAATDFDDWLTKEGFTGLGKTFVRPETPRWTSAELKRKAR